MRNKYTEVHRTNPTGCGELGGSCVIVVNEVANKKDAGHRKRRDHALDVQWLIAFLDSYKSDRQKNGADSV